MLHKEFWGLLFLVFVGWVFLAGTPQGRINNVCRPIGWTGNVVVSLSALVVPDQQVRLQGYFDKFEYSCQYLNWRLFYQDDYNKYLEQQGAHPAPVAAPAIGVKSTKETAPAKAEAAAEAEVAKEKEADSE